jgi:DNA-directed RNA polymerase subunit RPC12/RpoP
MSETTFACPHCGQSLSAEPEDTGAEVECPSCSKTIVIPDQHEDPESVVKYQIDGATLMHGTGSDTGSIFITNTNFIFLTKSTVLSVGLFGAAASGLGLLFSAVASKLSDKFGKREPLSEEELLKKSGENHVPISKITEIKVNRKWLGGISLHVNSERGSWGGYFSFIQIPKEYKAQCKAKGMSGSQTKEQFQNELVALLGKATGVQPQATKGFF